MREVQYNAGRQKKNPSIVLVSEAPPYRTTVHYLTKELGRGLKHFDGSVGTEKISAPTLQTIFDSSVKDTALLPRNPSPVFNAALVGKFKAKFL